MGLELARQGGGIGAMTEREWPIVEGMIADLTPSRGEEYVRRQLKKVISEAERVFNQAEKINQAIYKREPKETPKSAQKRIRFDAQGNMVK